MKCKQKNKMSRLFLGKGDKIHSIQYPFVLKEQERHLVSEFQGRIIDSRKIAILLSVVENEDIRKSIYNMFDWDLLLAELSMFENQIE